MYIFKYEHTVIFLNQIAYFKIGVSGEVYISFAGSNSENYDLTLKGNEAAAFISYVEAITKEVNTVYV